MRTDYYMLTSGAINRDENTLYFENDAERRAIPVEKIYAIYAYGQLNFSSQAALYLCKEGIPVHFFGYYGNYAGTLYPRETLLSGDLIIHQAEHYIDAKKRLRIAQRFVDGASNNIIRNLEYYEREHPSLKKSIDEINELLNKLEDKETVAETMNVEGKIRETYYHALDEFLPEGYKIEKRTRQPPENRMNAMISFGNSLLYATTITEIYNTQLNPTISYLHEPFARRFSLALDIAEIFKPIIVDRIIFKLVNKKMLSDEHFDGRLGDMLFSEKGKRMFIKEYNEKLDTTINHKGLEKNVSYKRLIRLELYKLIKHLLGEQAYSPLVMWW